MTPATPTTESANQMGKILYRLYKSATESDAAKQWRRMGDEAMRYYRAADYSFDYQGLDQNLSFKARVSKTWEAFTLLIRHLNPVRPERRLSAVLEDEIQQQDVIQRFRRDAALRRMGRVQQYLNWSIRETDFIKQSRRSILDFLARGMGVMWTGVHPRTGIITSLYDSVVNLVRDPNALVEEDIQWKGRVRVMTRQNAIRMIPHAADKIRQLPAAKARFSDLDPSKVTADLSETSECVKIVEIWMLNGLTEYQGGQELLKSLEREQGVSFAAETGQPMELGTGKAPMKYIIAEHSGELLDAGPWEIPWWQDNRWPCEELVAYDEGSVLTPMSPLHAALGFQRAINWIVTLMMGKFRTTSRLLIFMKRKNGQALGQEEMVKALLGNDVEALTAEMNGEVGKISDFIEQLKWDNDWITPSINMLNTFEQKFEEASGVTKLLQYGEGNNQDRSAAATRLRERTAFARVDDMGDAVLAFHSQLARKEAIALQWVKGRDHIATTLGEAAAADFGFLSDTSDPAQLLQMGAGVEQLLSAYTLPEILRESSFTVDVGNSPRQARDDRLAALDRLSNQMLPAQLQSEQPEERALAYETVADLGKELGLTPELIAAYQDYAAKLRALAMAPPAPAETAEPTKQPAEGA